MEFCKNLYQIGVTPEMMSQKQSEILNIFNSKTSTIRSILDQTSIAGRHGREPARGEQRGKLELTCQLKFMLELVEIHARVGSRLSSSYKSA